MARQRLLPGRLLANGYSSRLFVSRGMLDPGQDSHSVQPDCGYACIFTRRLCGIATQKALFPIVSTTLRWAPPSLIPVWLGWISCAFTWHAKAKFVYSIPEARCLPGQGASAVPLYSHSAGSVVRSIWPGTKREHGPKQLHAPP